MRIRHIHIFVAAVGLLAAVSCTRENAGKGSISANPEALEFSKDAPTPVAISLSADAAWTAVAPSWVKLTPESGDGSATVSVEALPNEGTPRSGSVVFQCGPSCAIVKISQDGTAAKAQRISVYRFLSLPDEDSLRYELQGVVKNIAEDASGDFTLQDKTASVLVKGLYDASGKPVLVEYGIEKGDTLTLETSRTWILKDVLAVDARYLAHSKGPQKPKPIELTIKGAIDTLPGTRVLLKGTVMALSDESYILSDASGSIRVLCEGSSIKVGDVVEITGDRADDGLPVVEQDGYSVTSAVTPVYPVPRALSQTRINSYSPSFCEYVSVSGDLAFSTDGWTLDPGSKATVKVSLENSSILNSYAGTYVKIKGYVAKKAGGRLCIVASAVESSAPAEPTKVTISEWPVSTSSARSGYNSSWSKSGTINGDSGTIVFDHSGSVAAGTTSSNGFKQDAPTASSAYQKYAPRAYCTWAGDSFTLTADVAVTTGDEVGVYFELAGSSASMKYWKLEYLDGEVWKTVGQSSKVEYKGAEVEYTHTLAVEKVNTPFEGTVVCNSDASKAVFRLTAVTSISMAGEVRETVADGGAGAGGWIQLVRTDESTNPKIYKLEY